MGTPRIYGWIEIRDWLGDNWHGVVRIDALTSPYPDSNVYECLFWADIAELDFVPVAPRRGLPPDLSHEVQRTLQEDWGPLTHRSWVTWAEMQGMDWEEVSPNPEWDVPPHVYERDASGEWIDMGEDPSKLSWSRGRPDTFEEDGKLYRYLHLTRREAFEKSFGWPTLVHMMEALGDLVEPENVRLVVYFRTDYDLEQEEDDDEWYAHQAASGGTKG
jgi:hypothetical protein